MRKGFSLLELLAVLLVMSLLAGAAVVKLTPQLRRAKAEEVVRRLMELDRITRQSAMSSASAKQLVFDPVGRHVARHGQVALPESIVGIGACEVEVFTREMPTGGQGEVAIRYGSSGVSGTYGLRIRSAGQPERCYLVAGLSGQWQRMNDVKQIQTILGALVDDPR